MTRAQQSKALRMAVVGIGHMGRFHAEKILALKSVGEPLALTALFDRNHARAKKMADALGTRALANFAELAAHADAAVVAVPTLAHAEIAGALLDARLDVLVEKPIAATQREARELLTRARAHARVLHVGHSEWWNAALQAARPLFARPQFIEAQRLGELKTRGADVDVVRDLMIHDIHIVQRVLGTEPVRIEASGTPVVTPRVDIASARLVFPDGAAANLSASRVTPTPQRRIRFFQPGAYLSLDLLAQQAWCTQRSENASREPSEPAPFTRRTLEVSKSDALQNQLRAFVTAVRARDEASRYGGPHGRDEDTTPSRARDEASRYGEPHGRRRLSPTTPSRDTDGDAAEHALAALRTAERIALAIEGAQVRA